MWIYSLFCLLFDLFCFFFLSFFFISAVCIFVILLINPYNCILMQLPRFSALQKHLLSL